MSTAWKLFNNIGNANIYNEEYLRTPNSGFSDEAFAVAYSLDEIRNEYFATITARIDSTYFKFNRLYAQWQNDIKGISSTTTICMHPSYQQIIGMGEKVLPYIFEELSSEPGLWFWALKAITCEDPVLATNIGNIPQMTNDWLAWWEKNKHYLCQAIH